MSARLNSLWVGDRLGCVERACLSSALAVGHQVALYTYNAVWGVPDGVEILDAGSILPENRMLRCKQNGSVALGSDIFRYELLSRGLGIWIDTDVYFIRQLEASEGEYLFGWEDDRYINSAVLKMPATSQLLVDLLALVNSAPTVPPWWPKHERVRQLDLAREGRAQSLEEMPWATTGPKALTHFAKTNNLLSHASQPAVYYPLHWTRAFDALSSDADVWSLVTPETRTVHLWNHIIEKRRAAPNHSSFIADICRLQGVDVTS
jgi:hypothetical protein